MENVRGMRPHRARHKRPARAGPVAGREAGASTPRRAAPRRPLPSSDTDRRAPVGADTHVRILIRRAILARMEPVRRHGSRNIPWSAAEVPHVRRRTPATGRRAAGRLPAVAASTASPPATPPPAVPAPCSRSASQRKVRAMISLLRLEILSHSQKRQDRDIRPGPVRRRPVVYFRISSPWPTVR